MTERTTDAGDGRSEPAPSPLPLAAAVVEPADGPSECTLYPPDEPDAVILTTWMTAQEGSFVSLERAR